METRPYRPIPSFFNGFLQFPCSVGRPASALFLLICFLALPVTVQAETLDRIVAAVNNEVITASDLAHAVALNTRFNNTRTDRDKIETETLEGLITRRLLVQEARRLRFVDVTDQEIVNETSALGKQFGSDNALKEFLTKQNMTMQELSRMLGERLLVERFVEKKVGLFVRVSRDEAQVFFDEHASEFKGQRFQDVQKNIFPILMDRKIGQVLEQYIAELRGKANIRMSAR